MSLQLNQGQTELVQMKTGIDIDKVNLLPIKWPVFSTMMVGEEDCLWDN